LFDLGVWILISRFFDRPQKYNKYARSIHATDMSHRRYSPRNSRRKAASTPHWRIARHDAAAAKVAGRIVMRRHWFDNSPAVNFAHFCLEQSQINERLEV
jgi:hypothetical protein